VHEPPNDKLAASDTQPLRRPRSDQVEEVDKSSPRPGSEGDSVTDDTQPPAVRVWPPRLTTDTWTKSDVDISLRDTIEETQPLRKRAEPSPAAESKPAVAAEVRRCPRCEARLIDPSGFGLCPQCGYCRSLEEGQGKASARDGRGWLADIQFVPRWSWVLLAGTMIVAALAVALLLN